VQDLPPNPSGALFTAVNENNNTEFLLRSEADVGRGVWQPAVLIDDGEVAGADILPCEPLLEVRVDGEHGLLSERHGTLHRAAVGKLAHVRGQKRSHVARRRINLAGARPLESARFLTRPADRLAHLAVTLHGAAKQVARQRQCGRGHPERDGYPFVHQGR